MRRNVCFFRGARSFLPRTHSRSCKKLCALLNRAADESRSGMGAPWQAFRFSVRDKGKSERATNPMNRQISSAIAEQERFLRVIFPAEWGCSSDIHCSALGGEKFCRCSMLLQQWNPYKLRLPLCGARFLGECSRI